jgi:hypothetical protein
MKAMKRKREKHKRIKEENKAERKKERKKENNKTV